MRLAGFPVKKGFEEFDFEFQPSIDRSVISDLEQKNNNRIII